MNELRLFILRAIFLVSIYENKQKTISITILFFESLKNFLSKIFLVRGGCRFQSLKTSKLKGKLHMREKDRWAISCTYLGIMKKNLIVYVLCSIFVLVHVLMMCMLF